MGWRFFFNPIVNKLPVLFSAFDGIAVKTTEHFLIIDKPVTIV